MLVSHRTLVQPVNQVEQHGTGSVSATGSQCGIASWYDRATFGAANKSLPFGTRVSVTNLDNGQTVTVTIDDRGPFVAGRIIDLSPDAFAQIAPLGQGLANVCIHW
jgi:rare lipoprotein A